MLERAVTAALIEARRLGASPLAATAEDEVADGSVGAAPLRGVGGREVGRSTPFVPATVDTVIAAAIVGGRGEGGREEGRGCAGTVESAVTVEGAGPLIDAAAAVVVVEAAVPSESVLRGVEEREDTRTGAAAEGAVVVVLRGVLERDAEDDARTPKPFSGSAEMDAGAALAVVGAVVHGLVKAVTAELAVAGLSNVTGGLVGAEVTEGRVRLDWDGFALAAAVVAVTVMGLGGVTRFARFGFAEERDRILSRSFSSRIL